MRPNKALVWLLLGFFLVGEANAAPLGRLRGRLRSRGQQRANPPAPAAAPQQAGIQALSTGGAGPAGGTSTPIGGYPAIITSPADEDVILFDDAIQAWINGPGGGGGGGDGLQVVGTPTNGDLAGWNANGGASGQWEPRNPGAGVIDVQAYGASGRGEITTTGTASAASTTLTLASAATFAKGQGIAVVGAGATHGLAAPSAPVLGVGGTSGAEVYEYGIVTLTGDGGWSAVSTTTSTGTLGNATLSATNYNYVCWDEVANNDGFVITGRSSTQADRFGIAAKNGATNCYKITFQAGGYTAPDQTDIGKAVVGQASSDGILAAFDNTARVWYVIPTIYATDTFATLGSHTITGSTGSAAGTSTAVAAAHAWKDTGDASVLETTTAGVQGTVQPSFARRASTIYYPGALIVHPMSPTGTQYICTRIMPRDENYAKTSATATGSLTLGTTVGTEYQDGNIYWMPMPRFQPVDEPTSAVPDAHLTSIAAISGTTVTMADAATNAVTSLLVMHNDFDAFNDATTVAYADVNEASEVYLPPGNYNIITGDSETDTWSQWDNTYAGSNCVFGGSLNRGRSWNLNAGATIYWMPLSHRGLHSDTGKKDYFWLTIGTDAQRWTGGRFIYATAAEPIITAQNAWNRVFFFGDTDTGSVGQFSQAIEFRGAEFYGPPRIAGQGTSNGFGRGHKVIGCTFKWGGAQHDALWYGSLAEFRDNVCYGDPYENSTCVYTDDSGTDTVNDKMLLDNNRVYNFHGTECFRIRQLDTIVTKNQWHDTETSAQLLLCDSTFRGIVSNNLARNGGRMSLNGVSCTANGNDFYNSKLEVDGGTNISVTGGSVTFDANASDYFVAGDRCLLISGGTNVVVSGLVMVNNETTGPTLCVTVSGGTRVELNGLQAYSESGVSLTSSSSRSGTLIVTGGQYRSGAGPDGFYLSQNASAITIVNGSLFQSAGNDDTIYANNGFLTLTDVVSYCPVQFTSGVDGLEMDGCHIQRGSTAGTTTISAPNALITDTSFGENPTLTSTTGLSRSSNRITTSRSQTMTALAANTDNLLVGICDTLALTTSGTNSYNLTGLAGLALGNSVKLVNAEASGTDQITLVHASTSSAGNQFFLVGATNYSMDPGDWIEVQPMTWLGSTYYVEVARGP
jgi:hypothetical protein